jgi:hypothetical protein
MKIRIACSGVHRDAALDAAKEMGLKVTAIEYGGFDIEIADAMQAFYLGGMTGERLAATLHRPTRTRGILLRKVEP